MGDSSGRSSARGGVDIAAADVDERSVVVDEYLVQRFVENGPDLLSAEKAPPPRRKGSARLLPAAPRGTFSVHRKRPCARPYRAGARPALPEAVSVVIVHVSVSSAKKLFSVFLVCFVFCLLFFFFLYSCHSFILLYLFVFFFFFLFLSLSLSLFCSSSSFSSFHHYFNTSINTSTLPPLPPPPPSSSSSISSTSRYQPAGRGREKKRKRRNKVVEHLILKPKQLQKKRKRKEKEKKRKSQAVSYKIQQQRQSHGGAPCGAASCNVMLCLTRFHRESW